jgi:hypothetical protein
MLNSSGISRAEVSGLQAGISNITDDKTQKSISAQLELMNRLLMINAAIGIKNQSHQNNQISQSSQNLNSLLQNQELLTEMDIGQLESLVQGFLGQNSGTVSMLSLTQRPSGNLNAAPQPFNANSRSMDSANYFNPQASQTKLNEIQRMLMQQPISSEPSGSNSQLFPNQSGYLTLPSVMGTYGSILNQGAQSMTSPSPNFNSFPNMNFPGNPLNILSGMFNPKMPGLRNMQGNFQDFFRQATSNFPRGFEGGDDFLQKAFLGVKEEDRHN